MEQNRRNKGENKMDVKKVKGKAIIGIAMAAIMLASVLVATVPMVSAESRCDNFNHIVVQPEPQKVLIGQNLQFDGFADMPVVYRLVGGDKVNTYLADADNRIYNVNWPTSGSYYVNYVDTTTYDAQLSVEDAHIQLKLKVGTKEVSSIAVGTHLRVDTAGINLFDEDRVGLKIIGPDGRIKYDEANDQQFTNISVSYLKDVWGGGIIHTTGWEVGDYTFQVKTKSAYACGLDAASAVKYLKILKGEIAIEAETTSTIELEQVTLTVTGVAGDEIMVDSDSVNVVFKAGIYNTPLFAKDHPSWFDDAIDADGVRKYAVEFNDTGTYTLTVTVTGPAGNPRVGDYDTVDITVSEKAAIFDVPSTVVISENFTIRGTANTGDTVDIAVDDYMYPLLNDFIIDEDGEFSKEIYTATAGIAPFTDPGPVRLTAYIERAAGVGPVFWRGDGSEKIFMLNDAGGGIDILTSESNVGKNETIILAIEALPGHNVSVATADTAHTVFEYNRYDFTGTSNNIINIAPADTISILADIGDCDSQDDAMNIHGVWKTMDGDGIRKFEVHFTDTGTYKITATDYGTDYPNATRLDEENIEITVSAKNVTFDVPSIVVIGDKITIRGTATSGTYVDIFADDKLYSKLDDIVIEDGAFSKEVITTEVGLYVPGIAELRAYIDCPFPSVVGSLPPTVDDGSTNVFMVEPWLTASLSMDSVDQEDEFTVSGSAPGSREVVILSVPPKGGGGKSLLDKGVKGVALTKASVSTTDNTFSKKFWVQEDADSGVYYVIVLSPGMDGEWDMTGTSNLETALDLRYRIPSLTSGIINTKTPDQIVEIFEDLTQCAGSDDLMRILTIKVGKIETLTLNPMADVAVGNPLKVTGETSREDGSIIWITVKGRYQEIATQAAIVKNNIFSVTFDTTGAQPGTYAVKAIDEYGYTAATTVDIIAETPA